jgi:NAD(P)H-hydrate repair Nnr-like enzyme with NAD(P)H-hydrate dehydratase domain
MSGSSAPSRPTLSGTERWADEAFARSIVPHREVGAHKWGVGGVLVIAGSPSYTGAAWLTCRSAGRAGAGIVRLATGNAVVGRVAGTLVEVGYVTMPETESASAARRAVELLEPSLEKVRAVVVGPGLDDDETTHHLLSALFAFGDRGATKTAHMGFGAGSVIADAGEHGESPLFANEEIRIVIDADGLNWLARQEGWWDRVPAGRLILTPHIGEMSRLTGREAAEILEDPKAVAAEYAKKWGQTVVIKTGYSVVSDGTTTIVADDAPPSLATAGTGDVFAGMIGALLAQGLAPLDAVGLAFYLGAQAARTAEAIFGELGVIATDLPDVIATELRQLT